MHRSPFWKPVYCTECNQLMDETLDEFLEPSFYTAVCIRCEKQKEKSTDGDE
jgi:hypothetical protein